MTSTATRRRPTTPTSAANCSTCRAAPLGFSVGLEHRTEDGYDSPDALINSGNTTGNARTATDGGYDVDEAYLELAIPVLADLPGAKLLDFSAGHALLRLQQLRRHAQQQVRFPLEADRRPADPRQLVRRLPRTVDRRTVRRPGRLVPAGRAIPATRPTSATRPRLRRHDASPKACRKAATRRPTRRSASPSAATRTCSPRRPSPTRPASSTARATSKAWTSRWTGGSIKIEDAITTVGGASRSSSSASTPAAPARPAISTAAARWRDPDPAQHHHQHRWHRGRGLGPDGRLPAAGNLAGASSASPGTRPTCREFLNDIDGDGRFGEDILRTPGIGDGDELQRRRQPGRRVRRPEPPQLLAHPFQPGHALGDGRLGRDLERALLLRSRPSPARPSRTTATAGCAPTTDRVVGVPTDSNGNGVWDGEAGGDSITQIAPNEHHIGAATYHDVSAYWNAPWNAKITVGVNNVFDKNPPIAVHGLRQLVRPAVRRARPVLLHALLAEVLIGPVDCVSPLRPRKGP